MTLAPELLGALRILLMTAGSFAVGKGWVDEQTLSMVVGALITLGAAAWAMYAKRASSVEARTIAGRVEVHPTAQPIVSPSPLDEKVKDAHL